MSAPCWSGFWKIGPSRVLSHMMIGRWPCASPISSAIRRISAMSTMVFTGLEGDSDHDHRDAAFAFGVGRRSPDARLVDAVAETAD